MAAITRIEVANFLSDGYEPGKQWVPLYRGETLRLAGVNGFGSSTAIQIENAGGKTSLTEACLFLLTRNSQIKSKVMARVAPADSSWTHVRIEFAERPLDDEPAQRDLIVINQQDVPGLSYVVGIVWSRGKDPIFYRYQGALEDVPCFRKDETSLALIDNETFKASVKRIQGAKWDTWRNAKEWEQEIKFFCDTEVLKQNVQFQLDGAGDYSAVFNKVNNKNGDGYDVNFFRQIIAPELLCDPLGTEAKDDDERHFESALLIHLRNSVDRLLDISERQRELNAASAALTKFEPIEQKAQEVIIADKNYKHELGNIANDASVVNAIVRRKLPGIPNIAAVEPYIRNKKLMEALSSLVISQRDGVLITDSGLAELCGVETFRLNDYANQRGIKNYTAIAQPIDLKDDIKLKSVNDHNSGSHDENTQHIDLKDDIKKNGRGGRRKDVISYDLNGARKAIDAIRNLSNANIEGLDDILTRAFGIAMEEIDTNPYRREQNRLLKEIGATKKALSVAESDEKKWAGIHEALMEERTNAETNQIAFETFRARANEFLLEHVNDPLAAKKWAEEQLALARQALEAHHQKVVDLTARYEKWCDLYKQHMGASLQGILDDLVTCFDEATNAHNTAEIAIKTARTRRSDLDVTHKIKNKELTTLTQRRDLLKSLSNKIPDFIRLFGDVDPERLNPGEDLQNANNSLRVNVGKLQKAVTEKQNFEEMMPAVKLFREIFISANPDNLDPTQDLRYHNEKIGVENDIINDHQPFVEAIALFMEANSPTQPNEWLENAEKERIALGVERQDNRHRTDEIKRELTELESAAVADDRVYAAALAALEADKVRFSRLHSVITAEGGGNQASLLTLFSSALSAPVVDTLEDAEKSTEILERAKLTVPVFLRTPLIEFIGHGEYKVSGKLVHTYLVGRHTRQVEIILNPSLVAEERERLNQESKELAARMTKILIRLRDLQPASTLVEMAVKAKKAIERNSVAKHAEATSQRTELFALLPALEQRAAPQAVTSISVMKNYLARGGEDAYNTLVSVTMPQLETYKAEQEKLVEHLQPLTFEEPSRILHAAKDYKREGGDRALDKVCGTVAALGPAVDAIAAEIDILDGQINTVLSSNLEKTTDVLKVLNNTFQIEKRDLEDAIAFEVTDDLDYMKHNKEYGIKLNCAITQSGDRLNDIDFERAARFVRPDNEKARNFSDRIAVSKGNREQAKEQVSKLLNELVQMNGRSAAIKPFIEDLHNLVIEIRTQYAKIASFSDDIRKRMSDVALAPEIMEYTDAIHRACLGEQASTNDVAKSAIANLSTSINQLEIDTRPLTMRAAEKTNAFDAFQSKRAEFCEKARSGEIKGLQLPEIERIAEARTIEQLAAIHQIKDKISTSIKEHQEQLSAFQQAMEESKAATIDNMTRFARQAKHNLAIMERVMQKSPNARFFVHAEIADSDKIRGIIDSLVATIQERETTARERGTVALNDDIQRRNQEYLEQIHTQIYHKIFSSPSVYFSHKAIRGGDKTRLTGEEGGLSGGQRTALMMMWLIKQADYALTRAIMNNIENRRDQKAALRGAQRIMFFDGLFSNLSSEEIINGAFQGLSDVDQNFQLIGLIHNPSYINNKDIFPVHLVGKRYSATKGDKRHCFMSIDNYENKMGFFQSAYRNNTLKEQPNA